MTNADINAKKQQLAQLRDEARQLETEILDAEATKTWRATGFYSAYYATTGFMLGMFGAAASLIVNVIGAPIAGRHPLEIIRVYLTFPLGEQALQVAGGGESVYVLGDGVILAIGCCLYIATGMVLGVPFNVLLTRFGPRHSLVGRLVFASVIAALFWALVFYGILAWLQPALFGGNWITDNSVLPWWVALGTHLVFGWTMALVYPFGQYIPYERPTRVAAAA